MEIGFAAPLTACSAPMSCVHMVQAPQATTPRTVQYSNCVLLAPRPSIYSVVLLSPFESILPWPPRDLVVMMLGLLLDIITSYTSIYIAVRYGRKWITLNATMARQSINKTNIIHKHGSAEQIKMIISVCFGLESRSVLRLIGSGRCEV